MKKILVGVAVLVVIAGVAVFMFLDRLNDIVRAAVEKVGSDLTQTEVVLNEVDIELASGRGSMRGFTVTNPKGFSTDDAFKFDEVTVELDLATVQSDPVVIRELVVQGPEVFYEFTEQGNSNLQTLNDSVQSRMKSGETSDTGSDTPRIIIENLYLRDGTVSVRAPLLNEKVSVPMPTIHLTDIGKDGRGATPAEIADQTMEAILQGARDAVARSNIDIDKLTGAAMEEASRAAEGARKALEDATSGAGDLGRDAGDSLKGLLGR